MDLRTSTGPRSPGVGLRRLVLLAATLFASAALVAGCGEAEPPPQTLTGMTRTPPLNVSGATLPQTNPKRASTDDQLRGPENGLMLVYFGYTLCPDVCPATFADLRLAMSKLDQADRDRVEVAMATVDPKRDTPKVLNRYVGHFFPKGDFAAFVPANPAQLKAVERKFDMTHRYGKPDKSGYYEVEHAAQVFAIDHAGQVLVEWPFGSDPNNVAADIRLLLEQLDDNQTEGSETA